MLEKININEFIKKTKEEIIEQKALITKSRSFIFYPIFLLYSITIIFLLKLAQFLLMI